MTDDCGFKLYYSAETTYFQNNDNEELYPHPPHHHQSRSISLSIEHARGQKKPRARLVVHPGRIVDGDASEVRGVIPARQFVTRGLGAKLWW